jgi:hypothetical protein
MVFECDRMTRKTWRRTGWYATLLVVYLASTVPVGLFIYSIKTEVGLDIFREGGFHAYMGCLSRSFPLQSKSERVEPASLTLKELELLARNAKSAARAAALEAVEYERLALKLRRQGQVDLQKSKSQ